MRPIGWCVRFAAIAAFAVPALALADAAVDFSGNWVARTGAAADSKPQGDASDVPARGGRGGHMGGRGMGGGRSHGGAGKGANASTMAGASDAPVPRANARAMIIRQTDEVFDIEVDGQRMAYRFDGKHNYGPQYGGTVSVTWAAPEMVIETHPDAGGSVEEHYTLAPDGKTLTLVLRTERAGDSSVREVKRVFVHPEDAGQKTAAGVVLP